MKYNLGTVVRNLRQKREITQKELESRSGVAHTIISRIENQKITDPRLSTVVKLAGGLNIEPEKLLELARSKNQARTIVSRLRKHADKLTEEFGVLEIGLFGSYARGEQKPSSDLDFLVKLKDDEKDIFNQSQLHQYLSDLFDRPVDITLAESVDQAESRRSVEEELIYA